MTLLETFRAQLEELEGPMESGRRLKPNRDKSSNQRGTCWTSPSHSVGSWKTIEGRHSWQHLQRSEKALRNLQTLDPRFESGRLLVGAHRGVDARCAPLFLLTVVARRGGRRGGNRYPPGSGTPPATPPSSAGHPPGAGFDPRSRPSSLPFADASTPPPRPPPGAGRAPPRQRVRHPGRPTLKPVP